MIAEKSTAAKVTSSAAFWLDEVVRACGGRLVFVGRATIRDVGVVEKAVMRAVGIHKYGGPSVCTGRRGGGETRSISQAFSLQLPERIF
jgi:hypothetical protein